MSADDEIIPAGQIEVLEMRQLADQAGFAEPPIFQGDQTDRGGGRHAAFCPNQPDSRSCLLHVAAFVLESFPPAWCLGVKGIVPFDSC